MELKETLIEAITAQLPALRRASANTKEALAAHEAILNGHLPWTLKKERLKESASNYATAQKVLIGRLNLIEDLIKEHEKAKQPS